MGFQKDRPVIYASLETDLFDGGGVGGLGALTTDTFYEAVRRDFPLHLFAPHYPKTLRQQLDGNSVKTIKVQPSLDSSRQVEVFRLDTSWYPVDVIVYLHKDSTNNTKAYSVRLIPVNCGNEWLNELSVYGETDKSQEIFLRYAFAKAVLRFQKRNGMSPLLVHLQESDTAFAIPVADEEGAEYRFIGHTHTPEPHGHKKYDKRVLESLFQSTEKLGAVEDGYVNFGKILALYSDKLCCVSKLHERITKEHIYPELNGKIVSVTNGVHPSWISHPLQYLLDKYAPGWKEDPTLLHTLNLTDAELLDAHCENKKVLARQFRKWRENSEVFANFEDIDANTPLVVYAKRLTQYKNPDGLLKLTKMFPDTVFIFAGSPIGEWGENFLKVLLESIRESKTPIAYVLNYNRSKSKYLVPGSDVWLQIPEPTREASGTSWHKKIINGGILVSTPAGSTPELIHDGENGFIVNNDLSNLGEKLEKAIYLDGARRAEIMRGAIHSSPFVTTVRMFDEYISRLYTN